jgi:hypothetical protein
MATITLEYDVRDIQAQKTLEYILSLVFFKQANTIKDEKTLKKEENLIKN